MLPSDPGYTSKAPLPVQQMPCFQQMLQNNFDPYADYSLVPELCQKLELTAGLAVNQEPPEED